jgi:hypothetical protein
MGQAIPVQCFGANGWKCNYSAVPFVDLDANGNLTVLEKECDGRDNNCNGIVDLDGFPTVGQMCAAGVGVCQGTGTVVCTSLTTAGCNAIASPMKAVDELCNGKDDDCDGQIDERAPVGNPTCYNGGAHACIGWRDPMVATPKAGGGTVYVYQFEATRPDATATAPGANSGRACANVGVLPWADVTETQAQAACAAIKDSLGAPMRLCTAPEWQTACEGPGGAAAAKWSLSVAPANYVAQICNDVNESVTPAVWVTGANGAQSVATGNYCYTDWVAAGKLHDLSGNLSEWTSTVVVSGGTTYYKIRGGSYTTPQNGATCEFDFDIVQATFANSDVGFRCCSDNAP